MDVEPKGDPPPAEPTVLEQPCPHCGSPLSARGYDPGTWLLCPKCSRPVRFTPQPTKPAKVEDLVPPRPAPLLNLERRGQNRGCFQIFLLSVLSGFSVAFFNAFYLLIRNPWELIVSWIFGAALGWFVSTLASNTSRRRDFESGSWHPQRSNSHDTHRSNIGDR